MDKWIGTHRTEFSFAFIKSLRVNIGTILFNCIIFNPDQLAAVQPRTHIYLIKSKLNVTWPECGTPDWPTYNLLIHYLIRIEEHNRDTQSSNKNESSFKQLLHLLNFELYLSHERTCVWESERVRSLCCHLLRLALSPKLPLKKD